MGNMQLKQRLSEYRKASGISQEEAAEKLKVSRQTISRWEHGQSAPSAENLLKLSKLYDVSLDVLVNDDWTPPTESEPEEVVQPTEPTEQASSGTRLKITLALSTIILAVAIIVGILFFCGDSENSVSMNDIGGEVLIVSPEGSLGMLPLN